MTNTITSLIDEMENLMVDSYVIDQETGFYYATYVNQERINYLASHIEAQVPAQEQDNDSMMAEIADDFIAWLDEMNQY